MFGRRNDGYFDSSGRTDKGKLIKDIFTTLLILLLFAGVFFIGNYASNRINKLSSKNSTLLAEIGKIKEENKILKDTNASLIKEKNDLLKQLDTIKKTNEEEELRSRGINPDILDIKKLNVDSAWKISSFNFQLKSAYLTPDVADLGEYRENANVKGKYFLMLEIEVSDERSEGEERKVPVSDHVKISKNGLTQPSFTKDHLYLSPKESGVSYMGFAVNLGDTLFELRSGFATNPDIISLDFESEEVINLKGVFMLKQGFAKEYSD